MNYLVWFGVFLVLAVLATVPVHFHLSSMNKKESGPDRKPGSGVKMRDCPGCGSPTPIDAAFCDKCGVPMMLWSLKQAREVQGEQKILGKAVPIINQDICIGCSACVNACDDAVLEIVAGKSAVTNVSACTSAGTCVEVCPTGACQLGGGGAARRVEVPQIDGDFQTNQPGIYAVGELGGLGLIKSAIAEGQLVIERIAPNHHPREGLLDLVIVGSGPAGISAALAAKTKGLSAIVLEQGNLANTIRKYPNRKIVMAEPIKIPMYGSLWISDAPKETLLGVWQTIIDSSGIVVKENEKVLSVQRQEDGSFITGTSKGAYHSQKVILAIGKRGTPNELPAPGAELPKVLYTLTDTAQYRDSRILVVGGGDSAAEAAMTLARQPGNEVVLSYRRAEFTRLKPKNLEGIEKSAASGELRLLLGSQVTAVTPTTISVRLSSGQEETIENDYVFAFLGGTSPRTFLAEIGVEMVTKEVAMELQKGHHEAV